MQALGAAGAVRLPYFGADRGVQGDLGRTLEVGAGSNGNIGGDGALQPRRRVGGRPETVADVYGGRGAVETLRRRQWGGGKLWRGTARRNSMRGKRHWRSDTGFWQVGLRGDWR